MVFLYVLTMYLLFPIELSLPFNLKFRSVKVLITETKSRGKNF